MCPGPDQDNPSDRGTYSFFAGDTTKEDVCNGAPAGTTCSGESAKTRLGLVGQPRFGKEEEKTLRNWDYPPKPVNVETCARKRTRTVHAQYQRVS